MRLHAVEAGPNQEKTGFLWRFPQLCRKQWLYSWHFSLPAVSCFTWIQAEAFAMRELPYYFRYGLYNLVRRMRPRELGEPVRIGP